MGRPLTATRKAQKVAPPNHVTYAQAAERLGVGSIRWIEKLVAGGELGYYQASPRVRFIPEQEIASYIARKTTQARPLRRGR